MPPLRSLCRGIIWYVLGPVMLAPMAAYCLARVRGGFTKPPWTKGYVALMIVDLAQGLVYTAMAYLGIHNLWFRHLIIPLVFIGMLGVVHRIRQGSRARSWFYAGLAGMGLAAAVAGYFVNGPGWRNALFSTTEGLIFLTVSVVEMRHLLLSEDDRPIGASPEFWLLAALLVYASGTMLFNASSNYFLRKLPAHLILIPWVVVNVVYAAYHLLLAKVFLCPKPSLS